ncbi:MAG: TolB family protein, partial [Solirubrobacteraceae bacterium]
VGLVAMAAPAGAPATAVPGGRTLLLAPPFVVPTGASGAPSISPDGRYVAFVSAAGNLTVPAVTAAAPQIYVFDAVSQTARLASSAPDGAPASDASSQPSLSADGQVVAFASRATNLAPGAAKATTNIYVKAGDAPARLLTTAVGGAPADGSSYQPAISADGRYVAFTSNADDLIAGDDNGKPDIFEYDLGSGALRRVSTGGGGAQADGPSSNPSINADGRSVTFASSSTNLAGRLPKPFEQVYVHDMLANRTDLISIGRRNKRQNAAVSPPFTQVSSVSADGRFVAFDSDATNLTRRRSNGHTNVFVRDRFKHTTTMVSLSSPGTAGNDDSFSPAISPDGHFVIFDSLADDLAPAASPGPNVYVRDLTHATTTTVDVTTDARPRSPEIRTVLQQPAISRDGLVAVFESGAANIVGTASNGVENLFLRRLAAPRTIAVHPPAAVVGRRPSVEYRADDPFATIGLCELDGRRRICRLGRVRLPALKPGIHRLSFAAGGPGMLFDPAPVVTRFRVR